MGEAMDQQYQALVKVGFWGIVIVIAMFLIVNKGHYTDNSSEDISSNQPSETMIISTAMEDVKKRLKDPNSAGFSETKVSRRDGATVVCGYVNANNSFGGKSGRERFIVSGLAATLESDVEAGGFQPVWDAFC